MALLLRSARTCLQACGRRLPPCGMCPRRDVVTTQVDEKSAAGVPACPSACRRVVNPARARERRRASGVGVLRPVNRARATRTVINARGNTAAARLRPGQEARPFVYSGPTPEKERDKELKKLDGQIICTDPRCTAYGKSRRVRSCRPAQRHAADGVQGCGGKPAAVPSTTRRRAPSRRTRTVISTRRRVA